MLLHRYIILHLQIQTHGILKMALDGVPVVLHTHDVTTPIFYCEAFIAVLTLLLSRFVGTFVGEIIPCHRGKGSISIGVVDFD
jgi:hypothetical protein